VHLDEELTNTTTDWACWPVNAAVASSAQGVAPPAPATDAGAAAAGGAPDCPDANPYGRLCRAANAAGPAEAQLLAQLLVERLSALNGEQTQCESLLVTLTALAAAQRQQEALQQLLGCYREPIAQLVLCLRRRQCADPPGGAAPPGVPTRRQREERVIRHVHGVDALVQSMLRGWCDERAAGRPAAPPAGGSEVDHG
jgi:hypothetical protein